MALRIMISDNYISSEPTSIQPYHYLMPKQSMPMLDIFQKTIAG